MAEKKSSGDVSIEKRLAVAETLLASLKGEIGGAVVADGYVLDTREAVKNANREETISDLIGAAFQQLSYLHEEVCSGAGHTRRLLGWEERDRMDKADGQSIPEPDDVRTKLRHLLGVIGNIREIQCRTNERLAQGI